MQKQTKFLTQGQLARAWAKKPNAHFVFFAYPMDCEIGQGIGARVRKGELEITDGRKWRRVYRPFFLDHKGQEIRL